MDDREFYDVSENKLPEEEVTTYVENNIDSKEGVQNLQEELLLQAQTNACEEESACREEKDLKSEEPRDKGTVYTERVDSGFTEYVWSSKDRASSPYHINPENMREYPHRPNVEYSSPYGYAHTSYTYDEEKKNKDPKKALVVSLVAVFVSLALVIGGVAGYFVSGVVNHDKSNVSDSPSGGGSVNMTKNDSRVEVNIEPGSTGYTSLTRTEVVSLVSDAVVEITTSKVQTNSFFGGSYVTSGAGSGVVIAQNDEYAYIVTNYHVIEGASSVNVTFTDKSTVEAQYLDGDVASDIAMLRVKTDKVLPKIVCGSSNSLKVGEDVVAIGNPLGQLGGTVTEGIISALDRNITVDGLQMTLIQTSAAVNPGNSGGGLFNMAGELIGIVNAKQSAEGIEGLGFAIPIDSVYSMLVEIIETEYIHGRPSLGIEVKYVTDTWTARVEYGVGATGVFVTSSNNDQILPKDLLRAIDGQLITDNSSYAAVLSSLEVGETVTVELYRKGRLTTVEAVVEEYVPSGMFG